MSNRPARAVRSSRRHPTNPFWRYNLLVAAWAALYAWMGGWFGVGLYFLQSLIAMTLLRVIDYVEHYGLPRSSCQAADTNAQNRGTPGTPA